MRGGFGFFYDHVPLNVYVFNQYPDQLVTYYDAAGNVSAGPYLYLNTLGQVKVRHPFIFQEPIDGNFSPHSTNWTVQVEQPVGHYVKLRTGFMQSQSDGLVILDPVAPDPETDLGAHLLSGTGGSRYRQFEVTARFRVGETRQLMFSYVRSKGRGDLNDFGTFLGTFPRRSCGRISLATLRRTCPTGSSPGDSYSCRGNSASRPWSNIAAAFPIW